MRLFILAFILSSLAWIGSGTATATATPTPTIYRSPDSVFESVVPEGWTAPTPEQAKSTLFNERYRISYFENGITIAYFQLYFTPLINYTSSINDTTSKTLEAGLIATYKADRTYSAVSPAKAGARNGYKITFPFDTGEVEIRFVQVTADLVAQVEYIIPLGASAEFAAAHDLLFANVKISPENIQTPTPVPTATAPVLPSAFTDLSNAKTLHALNNVLELQVPSRWTVNEDTAIMRLSIMIEDMGMSYGSLQLEIAIIGSLDRTGQETDLKKAFQSYLDLMSGGGYGGFGKVSDSQVAGQVAYVASMSTPQSSSSGEIQVMDIGNGNILIIIFLTQPGVLPQLQPVYETILDGLVIRPENITTPTPVPPTPTLAG